MPGRATRKWGRFPGLGLTAAALVTVGLAQVGGSATASALGASPALRVGRLTLRRCATSPLTYCGGKAVPLDYSRASSPKIHIGFRWLPATATKHAKRTVLAVEGGPGFATTGTQGAYMTMMGPLRRTRNLLLVNLRGTGNSTVIDCPGLERYTRTQHQYGHAFNHLVAACGQRLNHTWRFRHGGGWVHASDLFNSAYSARDVAGVVRALRLSHIDLYGDSYGSWFAQVFASRYPGLLRSVTLDSTYQVLRLDPWYTTTAVTARRAFVHACAASVACATTANASRAWSRIAALKARLAHAPVTGTTVTPAGTRTRLTLSDETLVNLVNNAGFDPLVYRDLDAAGRALTRRHDAAPLLRLAAMSLGFDDTNYPLPEFSDGLYFAVACTDYVQLFGRSAPPSVRAHQYRDALRREPAHVFAPFTLTQWTSMDQYTEAYSACLHWPTPTHLVPPITRRPPLVPRTDPGPHPLRHAGLADAVAPRRDRRRPRDGPLGADHSRGQPDPRDAPGQNDACPASIFQRFLRDPEGLARLDASCARRVTPVHTVGSYPLRLADAVAARPRRGNRAGTRALQAASVALSAVGDETSRWPELSGRRDLGLRGGLVTFSPGQPLKISFHDVRVVTDAAINGTARWNRAVDQVNARLTVRIPGGALVRISAHWRPFGAQNQLAVISGSQGSRRLIATAPAP